MGDYIDIHSHILPQVDDGSKSLEQTIKMLNIAYSEGVGAIIATPHYHEGRYEKKVAELEDTLNYIRESIEDMMPGLELYLGSEIYYSQECISMLENGHIPTLAGSKYILVEFSPGVEYSYMKNNMQKCLFGGYLPILAHVQRYKCLKENIDLVEELIDTGIYIQLNAKSILGQEGRKIKKFSRKLLKNNLIHIIATDTHNELGRSPSIKQCVKYLKKKYGSSHANKWLIENPKKILSNEYI